MEKIYEVRHRWRTFFMFVILRSESIIGRAIYINLVIFLLKNRMFRFEL